MLVNEKQRIRFLREVGKKTQGDPQSLPDAYAIGEAIGLSREQTRVAALHLEERGWVRFQQTTGPSPIMITAVGALEVEKLMRPKWKQLLTNATVIMGTVGGIIGSLITLVLGKYIERWLFGP